MVIRPVRDNDLEGLFTLSKQAGVGLTLKSDKASLAERIALSEKSFASSEDERKDQNYLFILEESAGKNLMGTCGIEANVGYTRPFYSYRVSKMQRYSAELDMRKNYEELHIVNDLHGKSEICTLYLHPDYRKLQNGLLLSRSRFLFMAQFSQRFSIDVIAEMRGVSDTDGVSPFWNSLGRHFFEMDFESADVLTARTNKQLIMDLMPRSAIHVSLLTKAAQKAIGETHRSTRPALKILQREGFKYMNYIDIFDGGPTIEAKLKRIRSVRDSKVYQVGASSKLVAPIKASNMASTASTENAANDDVAPSYIISNLDLDFRVTVATASIADDQCMLPEQVLRDLNLKQGDRCRMVRL